MAKYVGQTYQVPLDKSGFNHNKNIDMIVPTAMVHPSRNILLNEGDVRKRGGTSIVDTMTGTPTVTGLFDYTLAAGTQFIVRGTNDGKLWKDHSTTIKTGWTVDKPVFISQTGDTVMFCNGADTPTTWNGSDASTTDLSAVPTDWTGTNFPKQIIFHGRGASLRGWAFGGPSTPKMVYITPSGSPTDFTQATILTLNIETGDGPGIMGAIEFGDRLIVFSKTRSFVIDDSSTNTNEWGYSESQWLGGVANHRLIIKTPNDLVCMMENGEIYSVTATQQYGDYVSASLTRPSYMHEWIKTYVDLTKIANFHGLYDPVLRAIKIFVTRVGSLTNNTALVYFIDRKPEEAWTILDNQDYNSGYSAYSAAVVRKSVGSWVIYTGDYAGNVWELNKTDRDDNSNGYFSGYRTPLLSFGNTRESKRYDNIRIISVSEGSASGTLKYWIDNTYINQQSFTFAASGGKLGSFVLGTDVLGGANAVESKVRIGKKGKRIQVEVNESGADKDFALAAILFDFLPLGSI